MNRVKALRLSSAMRSVVADLLQDRLRVGRGLCFRDGQPHCSFGHALSRAGFAPPGGLDILSNQDGLFATWARTGT